MVATLTGQAPLSVQPPPNLSGTRAASVDDAAAIVALIVMSFAAQPIQTDPPSAALRETADGIAAQLCDAGGALLIDDPATRVPVATVLWVVNDGGLSIGRLAVHPQWRRRGLATRLLGAAEELARSKCLSRLSLSTRLPLTENRRLFAAFGFIEVALGTHSGYASPTSVMMEKRVERHGPVQSAAFPSASR